MQQANIGKKIVGAVAAVIAAIVVLFLSFSAFEDTDRSKNYVCQFPVSGNYEVWTDGGTQWQGFGNVKEYNKTSQIEFTGVEANENGYLAVGENPAAQATFNDRKF